MKFLIQTENNKIKHDFSWQLLKSLEFQKWLGNEHEYRFCDDLKLFDSVDYIPVGSVEFVHSYIEYIGKPIPKPINVPEELFKYANRKIFNGTEIDYNNLDFNAFIKSNDKIKSKIYTHFINDISTIPTGNYQISEYIENIESEYRCFVHKNKLVGLQHYLGDFTIFPDIEFIKKVITNYINAPIAYTLDIGINELGENFIIEIHNFYSCGLYGFNANSYIFMLSQWWFEFLKNN